MVSKIFFPQIPHTVCSTHWIQIKSITSPNIKEKFIVANPQKQSQYKEYCATKSGTHLGLWPFSAFDECVFLNSASIQRGESLSEAFGMLLGNYKPHFESQNCMAIIKKVLHFKCFLQSRESVSIINQLLYTPRSVERQKFFWNSSTLAILRKRKWRDCILAEAPNVSLRFRILIKTSIFQLKF